MLRSKLGLSGCFCSGESRQGLTHATNFPHAFTVSHSQDWPSNNFRAYDRILRHGQNADSMFPSFFSLFVYPDNIILNLSSSAWKYFQFALYRQEACQGIYSLFNMVSSCCTLTVCQIYITVQRLMLLAFLHSQHRADDGKGSFCKGCLV